MISLAARRYGSLHAPIKMISFPLEQELQSRPQFHVPNENIEILSKPSEFYAALLDCTDKARERISLAALYVGTGELEQKLLLKLRQHCEQHRESRVRLLVDYNRGTRGARSTQTMLSELLSTSSACNSQLRAFFYHTGNLRGLMHRVMPARVNEIFGVQHIKAFVFDDEVLLSGANLSNDYFTNRQDRYIRIRSCREFADFLCELVDTVSECSFELDSNSNQLRAASEMPIPWRDKQFAYFVRDKLCNFYGAHAEHTANDTRTASANTTRIFASLHSGLNGLHHDHSLLRSLFTQFDHSKTNDRLFASFNRECNAMLASPYFSLTRLHASNLLHSSERMRDCTVLCASPRANGFYKSSGFSGFIPDLYSLSEEEFYSEIKRANAKINLLEYERDAWTFHGKGIWLWNDAAELSVIGSSNYSERSLVRDLEANFVFVSDAQNAFAKQLKIERQNMLQHCSRVSERNFNESDRRHKVWMRPTRVLWQSFL
jgi:CDP-diacylglycerol--glycerol-3-phosphate 3-phosphatidyltransferase